MVAAITETDFNICGEVPVWLYGKVATSGDWVLLDSAYPGTVDLQGHQYPLDNVSEALVWAHAKIVAAAAVATTTGTTVTYDGATANQRIAGGYYILNNTSGEIMYVVNDTGYDSTSGTLTVVRGALGTTAVAIGDNDEFNVLNCIVITTATAVGAFAGKFTPLPNDPKCKIFG